MSDRSKAWTRQTWETAAEYRKFCYYRDQPATDRTLLDAIRLYRTAKAGRPVDGPRTAPGSWKTLARDKRWTERVAAWDEHLDVQRQREIETENREATRQHINECRAVRTLLTAPFREYITRLQANDPELLTHLRKMSPARLFKLGAVFSRQIPRVQAAERLARGLESEIIRVANQHGEEEPSLADRITGNDEAEDLMTELLEVISTRPAQLPASTEENTDDE